MMKEFEHINVKTIGEAAQLLASQEGEIIAGGTDLLGMMKFNIVPVYPKRIVNIKTVPDLEYIKEESGVLKIGALTTLKKIAENNLVQKNFNALSQAASKTASPNIRTMGTISGNICQETRCWYFRAENNKFNCLKKNQSGLCYALTGDNRYHSIFGASNGCICVNPSDTAPALVALGATVITNKRSIRISDFFTVRVSPQKSGLTVLDQDEIVIEIQIPAMPTGAKSAFLKFANRGSIDFPVVNCAAVIGGNAASICLNAVAGIPRKVTMAEEAIVGKPINEENAEAAGEAAVKGALSLGKNKYKIQIAKVLVKRTILACK